MSSRPVRSVYHRETPRPRHLVGKRKLRLLRIFFRYSRVRDAYVLRGIGRHRGPVLRLKRNRRGVAPPVRKVNKTTSPAQGPRTTA
ncbi:MAG TPA: hypothetical protein VFQ12_01795 [Thermoleophilaceae bacterium]|nr:hypothetical protein [Thermoleophilaceae bacterium]